jgi:sugar phosphate isomerase/epimerase
LSAYQALSDSMGADFVIPAVYMSHRFDKLGFSDEGQKAAIDAMAGTGGTLWMWVGDPDSVANVAVEVVEEFVTGIVEYAVSNDVKVILYPHYNTYYPTTDDAMVLVEKIDHPSFGVAINLCHELMSKKGDVLAQTFANSKDRIAAIILSGSLIELDHTSLATLNDSTILSLDESEIDLVPFVQLIADSGFEGPIGFINFQLPYTTVDYLTRTMTRWNELCAEVGLYKVR